MFMPKPRKREQPSRKPQAVKCDNVPARWAVETTVLEPVRLRSDPPELWRGAMNRLREDFLGAYKELGPFRCVLFQTTTSKSDAKRAPGDLFDGAVGRCGGSLHNGRTHVTADGKPIYLKYPVEDAVGRPIVDSDARGILCELPTHRSCAYHGTPDASRWFPKIASRAGQTLLGSPPKSLAWIPPDTLFARSDLCRWIWTTFDLAWQGRHPSLCAERKTWFRPAKRVQGEKTDLVYAPYDLRRIRLLGESTPPRQFEIPEPWTERLPGYFISELPDLFQASADLIDVLLNAAREGNPRRAASTDVAIQAPDPTQRTPRGETATDPAQVPAVPTGGEDSPSKEASQHVVEAASRRTRAKRGRRPKTDANDDKSIADAWANGDYKTHADLDREWNLKPGTTKRALDRHRKRK